jgi:hypothetical protein
MKGLVIVLLVLSGAEGGLVALLPEQESRFVAVEIYAQIDAPIAAWQIELDCDAKIVAVEGVKDPPYYDPAALQGGRIILAQFTTEPNPPAGRVLLARVHLMESGKTDYTAKLMAAASPGGERISPKIDLVLVGGK